MKLLIIDDHSGQRALIRQLIQRPGDEVLECACAEEALKVAPQFSADWATVDFRLGGINGIALVRALRSMSPKTRSVIVSSYDIQELRGEAEQAGAESYIAKENLYQLTKIVNASRHQANTLHTVKKNKITSADIA